jgi:predicted nuclease of restriction endonuclease-like RecB superfamily
LKSPACLELTSQQDISRITYPSEREFARLLFEQKRKWKIIYEPQLFKHETKGTEPDFKIIFPTAPNRPVYVETTTSERGKDLDVKQRQKMVMKNAAGGSRYYVLYREDLIALQNKYNGEYVLYKEVKKKN